jgi:beta-fructofuranosidase
VDEYGIFAGFAFDADGVATVLYTGVRKPSEGARIELPCLATSRDDDLITWEKYAGNPVIPAPPPGLDLVGFRDHGVWREDGTWYQVIGSGIRDVGGTVFLYRSRDLVHWEYVHPILSGDRTQTGDIWECPDLFRLGDSHVLMVSPIPLRKTLYFIGTFDEHRFQPQHQGVVDAGGYFYAPQSFTDDQGRRVMFGWVWEGRDQQAQVEAGWAGTMTLPRVLVPRADGYLGVRPAPELESLRTSHTSVPVTSLDADRSLRLGVHGAGLELLADLLPGRADQVGLKVRCAPDGSEQTLIGYQPATGWLSIDREHASLDQATQREAHGTRVELEPDEVLRLHVFVDRSVIEVYVNQKACLTTRVYPTRADSVGVELFARGGPAELQRLDAWELGCIWTR